MTGNGYDVTGQIPGSVYSFLYLDNGLLPDPYYRANEQLYTELSKGEYVFERTFDCACKGSAVFLVFEGLDTLCTVYLNGEKLGETYNMHLQYTFDVSGKLKAAGNVLQVVCHSATEWMKQKNAEAKLFGATDCMAGYPYVRKAHSSMGWDWGPRLPDAGIWRPVYLLEKDSAALSEVNVVQRHEKGEAYLTVHAKADGGEVDISLLSPDGVCVSLPEGVETKIENPQLWWPNGLGKQPLYKVSVCLKEGGMVVDTQVKTIGLRDLKLVRKTDEFGESFYHEVNGVGVFAMGADYIPEDNLFRRINPQRTRTLLTHCKDCHFNAIRVWGGGYYPDDWFFELCDELGLLVFFDCMFACSVYDPDEKTMQSIEEEVRQNVARIRHHACLALVCGNNEIEWHFHEYIAISGREDRERLQSVYLHLFEDLLPKILHEVAPWLPYIPSSPTSGGGFDNPNGEAKGDCHDWEADFLLIRGKFYRYVSEFGFQSFPCEKTVNTFTCEEDRNPFSFVMERHQRSFGGNELILTHLSRLYRYPNGFSAFLYATQLLQAEAVRYRVEHFRRHRGRCMGTLYWQLNDIWPVVSWASIDACGRYKALQYAAKRFYSPVLLSCEEVGRLQTQRFVNSEEGIVSKEVSMRLCVTNDTLQPVHGTVKWEICAADSTILSSGEEPVEVCPLSVAWLDKREFPELDVSTCHVTYRLLVDGEAVSQGSTLFTPPKHYNFLPPTLIGEVCGDEVIVCSDAYAKQVEIEGVDGDLILEDNYFDMEKGERRVRILSGTATAVRLRSVYDVR